MSNNDARVIDTTLMQTAFSYLVDEELKESSIVLHNCFELFVNGYLDASTRITPIPKDSTGILNPLMEFWMEDAVVSNNSDSSNRFNDEYRENHKFAFLSIIADAPSQFDVKPYCELDLLKQFSVFQVGNEIEKQYLSRVSKEKWLSSALNETHSLYDDIISDTNMGLDKHYLSCLEYLGKDVCLGLEHSNIYDEYRVQLDKQVQNLNNDQIMGLYLASYGFAWYERGQAYGFESGEKKYGMHPLRTFPRVFLQSGSVNDPVNGIRWGRALANHKDDIMANINGDVDEFLKRLRVMKSQINDPIFDLDCRDSDEICDVYVDLMHDLYGIQLIELMQLKEDLSNISGSAASVLTSIAVTGTGTVKNSLKIFDYFLRKSETYRRKHEEIEKGSIFTNAKALKDNMSNGTISTAKKKLKNPWHIFELKDKNVMEK